VLFLPLFTEIFTVCVFSFFAIDLVPSPSGENFLVSLSLRLSSSFHSLFLAGIAFCFFRILSPFSPCPGPIDFIILFVLFYWDGATLAFSLDVLRLLSFHLTDHPVFVFLFFAFFLFF